MDSNQGEKKTISGGNMSSNARVISTYIQLVTIRILNLEVYSKSPQNSLVSTSLRQPHERRPPFLGGFVKSSPPGVGRCLILTRGFGGRNGAYTKNNTRKEQNSWGEIISNGYVLIVACEAYSSLHQAPFIE